MKNVLGILQGFATLGLVVGLVFSASSSPLTGQAGNDTVQRAQEPQAVFKPKEAHEEKPVAEPPKADAKDAIRIGIVERLIVIGELKFIEDEGVSELLYQRICDGSEKTVGDLRAACAEVKAKLAERGYYVVNIYPSSAKAYQTDTKTLSLTVDPARFGDVRIARSEEAGNWYSDEQILKRFKYVQKGAPFNYNTLRQGLRAVNAHPDLMSDTKLVSRSAATNETDETVFSKTRFIDAELTVDDSFPLHATLDLNNYAMPELNYWQMLLSVQYLNLTGADDVFTVSPGVTMNGEMWSIAASYLRPFDILRGGSWSVYGGYSDMNCDKIQTLQDSSQLNLMGFGGFAGLNTSWNLYDDEKRNLAFNLGIMWRMIIDRWEAQGVNLARRDIHIVPITAGFSYGEKQRDWLGGLDFASVAQSFNLYGD